VRIWDMSSFIPVWVVLWGFLWPNHYSILLYMQTVVGIPRQRHQGKCL
jgi:hypothetical protein